MKSLQFFKIIGLQCIHQDDRYQSLGHSDRNLGHSEYD